MTRHKDIVTQLSGSNIFPVLDLASGCWQIKIHPKDRHKMAFVTPFRFFEYVEITFGLTNAPEVFVRMLDENFRDNDHVVAYMDDILLYSKTEAECKVHLGDVLAKLRQAGSRLKPTKCRWFEKSVKSVGHIISDAGIDAYQHKGRSKNICRSNPE